MKPTVPTGEPPEQEADPDRVRLLQAIAQGLVDDAAGRTMDTKQLEESLENELGPITWP